jgi:tetratricopeptide (TPR) repeat protein
VILTQLPVLAQNPDVRRRDSASADYALALKLEKAGNFDQALDIYFRLVTDYPRDNRYFQRLKQLLRRIGHHGELIQVIEDHLKIQPADIQSYVEIGDSYLALGRQDMAMDAWENLLNVFPGNPVAERLVLSHMLLGNLLDEGRELLTQLRTSKREPAFFALDMGRLYASRLSYDLATDEYLNHLAHDPRSERMITNQLLQLPIEEELLGMQRTKLHALGSNAALRILARVEFKHRHYSEAVALHRSINAGPPELRELAVQLADEKEYDLARRLIEELLAHPDSGPIAQAAVLDLADIYLEQSQVRQTSLVASGFYPHNYFFQTPYIHIDDSSLADLRAAIALYDSVANNWQDPLASIQLADIKYRMLDDFDGALADLDNALANRRARKHWPRILIRQVDVWLAKGDLEQAGGSLQASKARVSSREDLNLLEMKEVELVFLSADRDSVLAVAGGLMAALGTSDPHFNDLLELTDFVKRFDNEAEMYEIMIESERLLKQNRRSEAISLLAAAIAGKARETTPLLTYRLAHLNALQGNLEIADALCFGVKGGTEFRELSSLMYAEIADFLRNDGEQASSRYLAFMDNYTMSVHYDTARRRYRFINPE